MSNHELPLVLTAEDQKRFEMKLAELPESSAWSGVLSVYLPGLRQVIVLLAQDSDIVSWCLMPARDEGHAHELTVLLNPVLRRELEIVCGDAKALADAAICRASQAARHRRNDTYPGEWNCGEA
jgi:hypothetical protein